MTDKNLSDKDTNGGQVTNNNVNTQIAAERVREDEFHVPKAMQEMEQWISFRKEWSESRQKWMKVPKHTFMSSTGLYDCPPNDASNGVTFTEAMEFVDKSCARLGKEKGADGVGFMFFADDDYVGVDFDDVYDYKTGEIEQWALDAVRELNSYTEVSISGNGLHVIVKGEIWDDWTNKNGEIGFEIYDSNRFFTISGRHLEGTPKTVNEASDVTLELQQRYLREKDEMTKGVNTSDIKIDMVGNWGRKKFTQKEQHLVNRACRSADTDFEQLWNGNWSGYKSQSQADYAFLCKLSFWTNGREDVMECIFRESGLMRPKFDRNLNATTWGRYNITKAKLANTDRCEHYYPVE